MTPQTQAFLHDPENGVWGDCFRTAIACVLDLDRDQVPHFMDGGRPDANCVAECDAWLAARKLKLIRIAFPHNPADPEARGIAEWARLQNPGVHYLLSGCSPRGTNHVTVARDGEVVWDPHPSRGGLVGPVDDGHWWLEYFGALV